MKKQLPKNVRQIGNVSDSSKIYVEDYVDTFFNQLCDKVDQSPIGAFLVGEIVQEEEEDYIYIYGAIRMKDIGVKGKEIQIGDNTWKKACEQCKEYFGDAAILGWFLTLPGQALEPTQGMTKFHQKFFPREKTLFVIKDSETREEKYFLHKFRDLLEWGGHYIYYEKNVEMQNYMIDSRKRNGMTPSESVEDGATANFRNVIRERMAQNEQKQHSRFLYIACTFLVLVVFVIGITMVNNYDKMTGLQQSLDVISDKVLNNDDTNADKPDDTNAPDNTDTPTVADAPDDADKPDDTDTPDDAEKPDDADTPPVVDTPDDADTPNEPQSTEPANANSGTENVYIVKKGDTLATISKEKYGNTSQIDAICKMNGLEDGNLIFIGQKLLLP